MKKALIISGIVFWLVTSVGLLHAQYGHSNIYDRIGIITEHGRFGAVPEENIDLFTGNLTLRFLDIHLPGPNGLDLKIWRGYNSKILKDRILSSPWGIQQEPYSWVGMGWSMHMGRVHNYDLNNPFIEYPDGRMESAWPAKDGSHFVTREFHKYDKTANKLYFRDGTVWTFGEVRNLNYVGFTKQVRVVTEIENSFGHKITITYKAGLPVIDKITDSLGRVVTFNSVGTTNPKLASIQVKNALGQTVTYTYTVNVFSQGGYYRLDKFKAPELSVPEATYEYDSGAYDRFELIKVNTPYGGSMSYTYSDHTFYFYQTLLQTRVVSQKKIKFSSSDEKMWTFNYPTYQNQPTGTVTIQGPLFDTNAVYHAYTADAPWRIGLIKEKTHSDGSYSEQFEWTSYELSNFDWIVLTMNLGKAKGPLMQSVFRNRRGDANDKETYLYEREKPEKAGLPTRINVYGNSGSLKRYKTLTYYFENNTTFENKYMVTPVGIERDYTGGGTLLKQTQIDYFTTAGSCGAVKWIDRRRSSGTTLRWNHTYSSSNPNFIRVTVDLPGNGGIEAYEYRYGVLSRLDRPGFTELSRTISAHDSSILSETNRHGGTMNFEYDNLGRIKKIVLPSGFNAVNAAWSTNSVSITQGGNTIVKSWDGMGRDLGFTESGDGTTLYYRKELDAEGRLIKESKGSPNSSHTYAYQYNAAGQVTKITDPRNKQTTIGYSSTNEKTVTDPKGRKTYFTYADMPGSATSVKDPINVITNSTYDGIDRLIQVVQGGSRTRNFAYDGLDNVTSETHPETGAITYTFNAENNLQKRDWSNTSVSYTYNTSNQIITQNSADETITYAYDSYGRVSAATSTKGWKRESITYNTLGSVTREITTIPGLSQKTTLYAYNANNVLSSITYPDGKIVSYTNGGLNVPNTASFSGKSLVSQAVYGYGKMPTSVTISGNGTEYTASYNNAGMLSSQGFKKSATSLFAATYGYDDAGNVATISQSAPNMTASFNYDNLDRLSSASYNTGVTTSYDHIYDNFGNLTTAKKNGGTIFNASINASNRIVGYSYDGRGNVTQAGVNTYVWDNMNRLAEIAESGATAGKFFYDDRGLRFKAERPQSWSVSIHVVSPNGGEIWERGSQRNIQWESQGGVGNVRLRYSIDGGQNYTVITQSTANTGTYLWTVPNVVSANCLVEVSEAGGTVSDTSDGPFAIVAPGQPTISLDQTQLNYGRSPSGASTSAQVFRVDNSGSGSLLWNVSKSASWLSCTPSSGLNFGVVTVSVDSSGLAPGTYTDTIQVSDPRASNNPRTVSVKLVVHGAIPNPFGFLDAPAQNQVCIGTLIVGGWALDDVEVERVEIKRLPVGSEQGGPDGLVYIGQGLFVEGTRPDVAAAFPNHPLAQRAGWGYALLTYGLPNQGMDDWFTICAIAVNKDDRRVEIGRRTIHCLNSQNNAPFGTIDTPIPGATVSGTSYINFGWVLTPQPDMIPIDGSTIHVYVSGVNLGNPVYNNYRSDVAAMFPGYANSNGAGGHFYLNTTDFPNGLHTIAWGVEDTGGQASGLGSRYFWIQNVPGSPPSGIEAEPALHVSSEGILYESVPEYTDIKIVTGYKVQAAKSRVSPNAAGVYTVVLEDLDRVEIELAPDERKEDIERFEGYMEHRGRLFKLPVGSTFDAKNGVFYWMPGPAFMGEYDLVFLKEGKNTARTRKHVKVRVGRMPANPRDVALGGAPQSLSEGEEFPANGPSAAEETIAQTPNSTLPDLSPAGDAVVLADPLVPTYYIYTHDGKLLAEYDKNGGLVRDYIYFGNMLIAEYRPGPKYYYYTLDQINSTRMITNDTGAVVYSAAHGPYGAIEKTWTSSYDPALKYSGKEREKGSGLDYFGARYYNHAVYRWLSPDPVRARDAALSNPQLWNLYAYCRNSPITYWDPDGMLETSLKKLETVFDKNQFYSFTRFWASGKIEDNVDVENVGGRYSPRFKYHAKIQITLNQKEQAILDHEKQHAEGYEWLYERNVEKFIAAEARVFDNREEGLKFGHRFFQKTVKWRPFKWKLHDPGWPLKIPVNIPAWITHKHKWEKWAQNKDWH